MKSTTHLLFLFTLSSLLLTPTLSQSNYNPNLNLSLDPNPNNSNDGTFVAEQYVVTGAVRSTSDLPRFGHTKDFGVFLEAFEQGGSWGRDQEDYVIGITISSIIVLSVAVVWYFTISLFRCIGQPKVGFLAGWFQHSVPILPPAQPSKEFNEEGFTKNNNSSKHRNGSSHHGEGNEDGEMMTAECLPYKIDQETLNQRNQEWNSVSTDKQQQQQQREKILEEFQNSPEERNFRCRVLSIRITFFVCGACLIVAMVLFYAKGIVAFADSLDEVGYVFNWLQSTTTQSRTAISSVLTHKDTLLSQIDQAATTAQSCSTLDADGRSIVNNINTVRSAIYQLDALLTEDIMTADQVLENAQVILDEAASGQGQYGKIGLIVTAVLSSVVLGIVMYMMAQVFVLAKWSKCGKDRGTNDTKATNNNEEQTCCCNCCYTADIGEDFANESIANGSSSSGCCSKSCTRTTTNTLILPMFILFLTLCWIFYSLTLIGAIAGADFCMQPDEYVLSVMDTYQDTMSTEAVVSVKYYISGCVGTQPFEDLIYQFDTLVDDSADMLNYFQTISAEEISSACSLSTSESNQFMADVRNIDDSVDDIVGDFDTVMTLVDCHVVNPMYTTFVYNATCINGVGGLTWIFGTTLATAVLAMLMLTFRAALRPIKEIPCDFVPGASVNGVTGVKSSHSSTVIGKKTIISNFPDGKQVTEVERIRNPDGTITEKRTIRMVPPETDAPESARMEDDRLPPQNPHAYQQNEMDYSGGDSEVDQPVFSPHDINSQKIESEITSDSDPPVYSPEDINSRQFSSKAGNDDATVISKSTVTSILPDGRQQVKEVVLLKNPDGSVRKKTHIKKI